MSEEISTCCSCGYSWKTGTDGSHSCSSELQKTKKKAIDFIVEWGGVDGAHHKDWTLDQVVRILAGEQYDEIVAEAKKGEDGDETYSWECGIAP
jgi:hypothetical protein